MTEISEVEAARSGQRPFLDLPWLCVDAIGEVAIFLTAGYGPVPLEIFASPEACLEALPVIEEMISSGSFYVYDYADAGWYQPRKAYVKIRSPFATVRPNASMLKLPHAKADSVRFSDSDTVIIEDTFGSINA